jgi:DnaJ family protein C protein 13
VQTAALRKLGLTLAVDSNAALDGGALLAAVAAAERERAATAADAPLGEWEVMRVRELPEGAELDAAQAAGAGGGAADGGGGGGGGWSAVAQRRLVLTRGGLLERRPGDYEVAEWRQLPAVAALVRHGEDPQWLSVEWADGAPPATYVTPARDALLAALLDAAQAAAGRPVPVLMQPTAAGDPILSQRAQALGAPSVAPDAELERLCLQQLGDAARSFMAAGGASNSLAALAAAGLPATLAAAAADGAAAEGEGSGGVAAPSGRPSSPSAAPSASGRSGFMHRAFARQVPAPGAGITSASGAAAAARSPASASAVAAFQQRVREFNACVPYCGLQPGGPGRPGVCCCLARRKHPPLCGLWALGPSPVCLRASGGAQPTPPPSRLLATFFSFPSCHPLQLPLSSLPGAHSLTLPHLPGPPRRPRAGCRVDDVAILALLAHLPRQQPSGAGLPPDEARLAVAALQALQRLAAAPVAVSHKGGGGVVGMAQIVGAAGGAGRVFAALMAGHDHVAAEAARLLLRFFAPSAARAGAGPWAAPPGGGGGGEPAEEEVAAAHAAKSVCFISRSRCGRPPPPPAPHAYSGSPRLAALPSECLHHHHFTNLTVIVAPFQCGPLPPPRLRSCTALVRVLQGRRPAPLLSMAVAEAVAAVACEPGSRSTEQATLEAVLQVGAAPRPQPPPAASLGLEAVSPCAVQSTLLARGLGLWGGARPGCSSVLPGACRQAAPAAACACGGACMGLPRRRGLPTPPPRCRRRRLPWGAPCSPCSRTRRRGWPTPPRSSCARWRRAAPRRRSRCGRPRSQVGGRAAADCLCGCMRAACI